MISYSSRALALFSIGFSLLCSAQAMPNAEASLDPFQEVPPHNTPAYGDLDLTYNANSTISYSLNWSDLLGGATAISINVAAAGSNGPLLFSIPAGAGAGTTTNSINGSLGLADLTAVGSINSIATAEAAFNSGGAYVNIRDTVFPSGELRGQIFAVPEPTPCAALLAALAIPFLRRPVRHRGPSTR